MRNIALRVQKHRGSYDKSLWIHIPKTRIIKDYVIDRLHEMDSCGDPSRQVSFATDYSSFAFSASNVQSSFMLLIAAEKLIMGQA